MRAPAFAARSLAFLLLPLLLAPAARAGDKEEEKRNAAIEKTFFEAYGSAGDEKGRAKAVETLSFAPDAVKVSVLVGKVLPKDDSPHVHGAAVNVLRKVGNEDAVYALGDVALGKGSWPIRMVVIEALGGSNNTVAVETLRKLLKNPEAKTVAASLFSLAAGHPAEVLEDVKKLTEHLQWQVRLGTLEYLARLKDPKTVGLLVDRLEAETGRLKHEVAETLRDVTGKDYGTDAAKWRAYAEGGEKAAADAGARPADPTAGGGGRAVATGTAPVAPTYYGLKVWSDKVVFVIDVSLSMNEEMVIDRDTLVRETGAVVSSGSNEGGAKTPEGPKPDEDVIPIEWWKIKTRMDFARSQLKYVVSILKRDQWFDVVWFSDSVVAWQGRMVPAARVTKKRAADWLDGLECEGGTNTWGGLTKALNLVGRGTDEENYGRGADTIYFLSDGQPSKGDIKDENQIVAAIERIHKVRHVKIHVIQIGTSPLPFMKRLAEVTGGDYKFFNARGPAK